MHEKMLQTGGRVAGMAATEDTAKRCYKSCFQERCPTGVVSRDSIAGGRSQSDEGKALKVAALICMYKFWYVCLRMSHQGLVTPHATVKTATLDSRQTKWKCRLSALAIYCNSRVWSVLTLSTELGAGVGPCPALKKFTV